MESVIISIVDVFSDLILYLRENSKSLKVHKTSKEGFLKNKVEKLKNESMQKDFSDEINNFITVLKSNFSAEDLVNFKKNIRSLSVYGVRFQISDLGYVPDYGTFLGRYDMLTNRIAIDLSKDKEKRSIYHELFHMASTKRGNILTNCGFRYYKNDKVSYGRGLNEGYTDILTQRYFYNKDYEIMYDNEYIYALLLERIIGKDKMESFYLRGDLNGLISELEKYDTLDNILHFIKELDHLGRSDGILIDVQRLQNISHFLIQAYMRKKQVNNENLYNNTTNMDVYNFIQCVPRQIEIEGKKYKLDLSQMVEELVNETFPEKKYIGNFR